MFLGILAQSGAERAVPLAVLRSGARVECQRPPQAGPQILDTPFGRYDATADPVVEAADARREVELLRAVRQGDAGAWLRRVSDRGLLSELAAGAADALASPDPADEEAFLAELDRWGARLDPVPAAVARGERVEWLWRELPRTSDAVRAALLAGRLVAEASPSAPAERRLTIAELRRGLRGHAAGLRRAAAQVAARQGDRDLLMPLVQASLDDPLPWVRSAGGAAAVELDHDEALGRWTLALWRDRSTSVRVRAAEHLGAHGDAGTVDALIYALAAGGGREPGAFVFFGRQISVVADVDVEVAQAAAIADPVVSVVSEGVALEVRVLSTTVTRTVMASLRRLVGADHGPAEEDWLRWYAESRRAAAG